MGHVAAGHTPPQDLILLADEPGFPVLVVGSFGPVLGFYLVAMVGGKTFGRKAKECAFTIVGEVFLACRI
jgi:hypothetical protein